MKKTFLLLTLLTISLTLGISCKKKETTKIKGCIDPTSLNYNPQAEEDDGSCIYNADKLIGTWNVSENSQGNLTSYTASVTRYSSSDNEHININYSNVSFTFIKVNWLLKTFEFPHSGTWNGSITNENDFEISYQTGSNNPPAVWTVYSHFTR